VRCGGRIGEREIACTGVGHDRGEPFQLHQKCVGWRVVAIGEVPDIRVVQRPGIPKGSLMMVPPRRHGETDDEFARRSVLITDIGDGS
jgi:hypothetical protein